MMIQLMAAEIARWIDAHEGRVPVQVRVSSAVMEQFKADIATLPSWPEHEASDGKVRLMGVRIVADPALTTGRFDE